ncbi:glutamate--cysteine ligase [Neisseria sp. Ec49-e6-T10]|uniref:glutamate--cysteine ligase n=1 Tax=Neisseria sp. Ec49-e6-T10 TaxID=3140744 RepID=UPI003EB6E429
MVIPHLPSALSAPLLLLEKNFLQNQAKIESWFRSKWHHHQSPFYGSVDLRNSGYKLAPVDMNLFPGGFNNLNPDSLPLAVAAAQSMIESVCPEASGILLIPENHTRNTFYLQNVYALQHILEQAGLNVRLGSLNPEITTATTFETALGNQVTLEPLVREGNRLTLADGFKPCLVLLNNDLSAGVPDILKGLEQTLLPPLQAGWYTRKKTEHFAEYDRVANEFAQLIDIDPWLINPYFESCTHLNFQERAGEEELAKSIESVLNKIKVKYQQYNIDKEPFVIVKADSGTYGMGIMSVKSPDDVIGLNRKNRNKMSVVKEGLEVHEVIIQEGVYTFERVQEAAAEPVVYMMNHFVIGGFYRIHAGRGEDENLNAIGMQFVPLSFQGHCLPDKKAPIDCASNRFYAYGVIARLSLLAGALELENKPSPF